MENFQEIHFKRVLPLCLCRHFNYFVYLFMCEYKLIEPCTVMYTGNRIFCVLPKFSIGSKDIYLPIVRIVDNFTHIICEYWRE